MGDVIKEALEFVKSKLKGGGHDLEHVLRVYRMALAVGRKLGADELVLSLAAILHDVGRAFERPERHHAEASAEIARDFLRGKVDQDVVEKVVEAIRAHSFSFGKEASSLEAKILSDVDKIDALGAIGIARVFMYSGAKGRGLEKSLKHFKEKILKLPSLIHLDELKGLAERRARFVELFLRELKRELELEDLQQNIRKLGDLYE